MRKNKIRQFREAIPLSLAELARRAGAGSTIKS